MTFTRQGERVTLEMGADEFHQLILAIGTAAGAAMRNGDKLQFYLWLWFANQLNATNPNWTPYEIPPEFDPQQQQSGGGASC